jgi:hypothetical protein
VLVSDPALDIGVLPAWSPAGDWIAYAAGAELRVISPDGTRKRTVSRQEPIAAVWSHDGRTLYAFKQSKDDAARLVAIDVQNDKERFLTEIRDDVVLGSHLAPGLRMTLHPDGRRILTTGFREHTELWILENFRPKRWFDWFRARR